MFNQSEAARVIRGMRARNETVYWAIGGGVGPYLCNEIEGMYTQQHDALLARRAGRRIDDWQIVHIQDGVYSIRHLHGKLS